MKWSIHFRIEISAKVFLGFHSKRHKNLIKKYVDGKLSKKKNHCAIKKKVYRRNVSSFPGLEPGLPLLISRDAKRYFGFVSNF